MRRLPLTVPLLAIPACSTAPPQPPIHVSALVVGEECRLLADGRPMTIDAVTAAAQAWRGRTVRLDMNVTTPYRCFGAAVFALQRAGVKRIGFTAQPPPAEAEEK